MASFAFDSSGSRDASRLPISLHPAFPAVVALWFAALLGLGSMVLPVVLIERVVEMTGLAALVPAATPPLGFMARGLIALASAATGAAIGVAIARRVARAHDAGRPSRGRTFAKGARRPIDVNAELGGEGLVNGFGLPVNRRRALAIAEDDRPSDFLYMAPLPGDDEYGRAPAFDEQSVAPQVVDEPLELSDALEDIAETGEPGAPGRSKAAAPDEDSPMTLMQDFQPLPPEPRGEARQEFRPAPTKAAAEPLPFSAPSLARRTLQESARLPEPEPATSEHEPDETELSVPGRFEPAPATPQTQPFRGDWSSAPLGELGLVQLVQRLGASLERRREWLTRAGFATPMPLLTPAAGFDPAPAEEAAQAMAAFFGKPSDDAEGDDELGIHAEPAAMASASPRPNPLGSWPTGDDDEDFDVMPSFTLPLRKSVAPTIAFDEPEPENDDDIEGAGVATPDDSFSSLLTMRNPFAARDDGFVRIDLSDAEEDTVEPAVVFPGHHRDSAFVPAAAGQAETRAFDPPAGLGAGSTPRATATPPDADAALRAALATLQRMSGTA